MCLGIFPATPKLSVSHNPTPFILHRRIYGYRVFPFAGRAAAAALEAGMHYALLPAHN
jgi:hypothetical protein